jgi:hypothetical protein
MSVWYSLGLLGKFPVLVCFGQEKSGNLVGPSNRILCQLGMRQAGIKGGVGLLLASSRSRSTPESRTSKFEPISMPGSRFAVLALALACLFCAQITVRKQTAL